LPQVSIEIAPICEMLEAVSNPVGVAIFFSRFASLICQKEADDPMILNLTFTYTGATPIIGPAPLGTFSAVSNFGQSHPGYFAAEGTLNLDGTRVDNVGVLPSAGRKCRLSTKFSRSVGSALLDLWLHGCVGAIDLGKFEFPLKAPCQGGARITSGAATNQTWG
jgi:hypothetical protein